MLGSSGRMKTFGRKIVRGRKTTWKNILMKIGRKRIGRKGFEPISLAIAAAIIMLASFLIVIMPILFLKVHLVQTVEFEYNYNNAQAALNTLLALTETDTVDGQVKPASRIIAEYVTIQDASAGSPDIGFLQTELDRMVDGRIFQCYKLTSKSGFTLAESSCTAGKYRAYISISTPESKDTLELMIS